MSDVGQQAWIRRGPMGFNVGLMLHALAAVLLSLGGAMFVAGGVDYLMGSGIWPMFVWPGAILATAGLVSFHSTRPPSGQYVVRTRDIYLAVTGGWIFATLLAALPLALSGEFRSITAAFFEAMSGLTTTGATIVDDVGGLSTAVLLWRSMLQWLGGIGIVVLFVAVAPAVGTGAGRVLFAEISGPAKERITPRISDTARVLGIIYLVLSATCALAYWLAGMSAFDAINHMMTSVSTAGFSTRTESIGYYDSVAIEAVALAFMVFGGISFGVYWAIATRRQPSRIQLLEIAVYLGIMAIVSTLIAVSLRVHGDAATAAEAVRGAVFSTVSVMTTTGYTVVDFDEWNNFGRMMIFFLMFIGGCAGSTAGGIKVIRWVLLDRTMRNELNRLLHPTAVSALRVAGRSFPDRVSTVMLVFLTAYISIFAIVAVLLAALGVDPVTALSAAAASINIVGPALGDVGAGESYAAIPDTGLLVLSAAMLLGRLEVFTVIMIFLPGFWRGR